LIQEKLHLRSGVNKKMCENTRRPTIFFHDSELILFTFQEIRWGYIFGILPPPYISMANTNQWDTYLAGDSTPVIIMGYHNGCVRELSIKLNETWYTEKQAQQYLAENVFIY
jgi:hypothetical protein